MAFYLRDNRQANYKQTVKKVQDKKQKNIKALPTFATAKTVVAILGFVLGALMVILAIRLGIRFPGSGRGLSLGAGSLFSGIATWIGAVIALLSRKSYLAAGIMTALLFFVIGLLIPVLMMDATRLMRAVSLPNAGLLIAAGMIGKTQFEGLKKAGLRK